MRYTLKEQLVRAQEAAKRRKQEQEEIRKAESDLLGVWRARMQDSQNKHGAWRA